MLDSEFAPEGGEALLNAAPDAAIECITGAESRMRTANNIYLEFLSSGEAPHHVSPKTGQPQALKM